MDTTNSSYTNWSKIGFDDVPSIDGHCCCVVDEKMYIFGGVRHTQFEFHESNTMALACPRSKMFVNLKASGNLPKPRSSSSIAAVNRKLYVFGGLNSINGWLDDFHVFDTETNVWHQVNSLGPKPSPRDKLACAAVGNKIYYFGGFGPLNGTQIEKTLHNGESSDEDDSDYDDRSATFGWFNDIFVFNTVTKTWCQIPYQASNSPTPRAASSMCAINDSLLVFGGRDKDGRCHDLFVFDTCNSKWRKIEPVAGSIPGPRSFHSSVVIGNLMVVVGGMSQNDEHLADVHVFDFDKLCWSQPKVNEGFSGRGRHTLNIIGDSLVVFGGSGDFDKKRNQCNSYFNDFFSLPKSSLVWPIQKSQIQTESSSMCL